MVCSQRAGGFMSSVFAKSRVLWGAGAVVAGVMALAAPAQAYWYGSPYGFGYGPRFGVGFGYYPRPVFVPPPLGYYAPYYRPPVVYAPPPYYAPPAYSAPVYAPPVYGVPGVVRRPVVKARAPRLGTSPFSGPGREGEIVPAAVGGEPVPGPRTSGTAKVAVPALVQPGGVPSRNSYPPEAAFRGD